MTKDTGLSLKADLALSDLESDGGKLTYEQNETFIRRLEDSRTIMNAIRVQPMNAPQARINSISMGGFITKPASQDRTADTVGHDGRGFKPAWRSKPVTDFIELNTKEVQAVVELPYEVLEDNIERGAMQNTVLALIADQFAYDMEAMIVRGTEGGADPEPLLNYMDGIYALATDHTVDFQGALISDAGFTKMIKAMPKKYRANLDRLRFFTGSDTTLDMRDARAVRATAMGDRFVEDNSPLRAKGIQVVGAANNPEAKMMLTVPENIIFGIQRNVMVETERLIEERLVKIVVTARVAVEIQNHDAIVVGTNLAAA